MGELEERLPLALLDTIEGEDHRSEARKDLSGEIVATYADPVHENDDIVVTAQKDFDEVLHGFIDYCKSLDLRVSFDDNNIIDHNVLPDPEDTSTSLSPEQNPATALKALASKWPEDLDKRAAPLAMAHLDYRREYASQLEPIVNGRLKVAIENGTSYDEKRQLVKQLNEELRLGGLAVQCEVRDDSDRVTATYPGILVAGTARHEAGRFQIEYKDAEGKTKRFGLSEEAPSVKLMPEPPKYAQGTEQSKTESFAERIAAKRREQADKRRQP